MPPTRDASARWVPALVAAGLAVGALLPLGSAPATLASLTVTSALAAWCWSHLPRIPAELRRPWLLATLALTSGIAADALVQFWPLWTATDWVSGGGPAPVARYLAYSPGHLLLGAALLALVRPRRRLGRAALLDAGILAASLSTVAVAILGGPAVEALGADLVALLLVLAFGTTNAVVAVALVRVLLLSRRGHRARDLAAIAGVVHLLLAIATAGFYASGSPDGVAVVLVGWVVVYGILAAAVGDRSAARPVATPPPSAPIASRRALLLLPTLLLVPLTLLLFGQGWQVLLFAGSMAVVLVLVGARIWLLLAELAVARERDLAEQTHRTQRRFEALVRHATDVVLLVDPERGIRFASPSADALFGQDPTGWSLRDLARWLHPADRYRVLRAFADHPAPTSRPLRLESRIRAAQDHDVEVLAVDLRGDPDVEGIVLTVRETTERAALERQLRHQASHDHLTGLGNRQLLQERLTQIIAASRRHGRRLALLMCDLDDFKDVNDTLGHAVGDQLLVQLARRLQSVTRASDNVVRLGGDEFAVLCEDIGSTRDAVTAARRLLEVTRSPFDINGHRLRIGMSVGVVVDTGQRNDEELLRDADVALYIAKERGKDRLALHRSTMTEETRARLQLAEDLQVAIEEQALQVAFQPIYDLDQDRLVGVEALARWTHPTRGVVSPAEFIPVAEHSGLVPKLGDLVLHRTLEALSTWRRARPDLDLYVAVNLSARELREPDAVARVAGCLHRFGIPPDRLILELTESGMLEDEQIALDVMHQLRDHGLRFAVDDFGTGYSSLSYLRRLPVDIVKIDRSFIEELGADDTADDLVRAIVELSRTLHLEVVAEGVETTEQRRILETMGCQLAQGYLLGRPTDEASILHLATSVAIEQEPLLASGASPGASVGS